MIDCFWEVALVILTYWGVNWRYGVHLLVYWHPRGFPVVCLSFWHTWFWRFYQFIYVYFVKVLHWSRQYISICGAFVTCYIGILLGCMRCCGGTFLQFLLVLIF